MKNLLLSCALLLALALPFCSLAAGPPDIVVVRIYEGITKGSDITAIITRGEGKSEKVVFEAGSSDKKLTLASEGYYKLIHQLYREGYAIQSTFSSDLGVYTTLVFVKAQ